MFKLKCRFKWRGAADEVEVDFLEALLHWFDGANFYAGLDQRGDEVGDVAVGGGR